MTAYPQAPAMSLEEIERYLHEAKVARLCTHNEDGTIHVAPVWYAYDGDEILIGTQEISRKARNVARDSQVSVMIDKDTPPYKGVLIYGRATLDYEDAIAKRIPIFARNMPRERAESAAKRMAQQFKPVIIRVRLDRIVSYDYAQ